MVKKSRFRGSLLGLAVGDCMGVPAEFLPPGHFDLITEMTGGGPFHLEKGEWTDDTSMALCLADSLIANQGFDAKDQIGRYVRWYKEGYNSSKDVCFDIGLTVREALDRYLQNGDPYSGSTDPYTAGNGSVMRLAPVPLVWSFDFKEAVRYSGESSKTTHQAEEAVDACCYYGALLVAAVAGWPKENLLSGQIVESTEEWMGKPLSSKVADVASGSYKRKQPPEIKGSGYVVQSIEAALWAFYHSHDFAEGLLMAVNLGDDADTIGAIYGQLAGAYYGVEKIPQDWLDSLVDKDRIESIADQLFALYQTLILEKK